MQRIIHLKIDVPDVPAISTGRPRGKVRVTALVAALTGADIAVICVVSEMLIRVLVVC